MESEILQINIWYCFPITRARGDNELATRSRRNHGKNQVIFSASNTGMKESIEELEWKYDWQTNKHYVAKILSPK